MFTGIIEAVGEIVACEAIVSDSGVNDAGANEAGGSDVRLRVKTNELDLTDVQLGDSIATNGVCLTVVELPGDGYVADVSSESLALTTIGDWAEGTQVNLELALTPDSRLGGHMVSGHVDDVGEVVSRHPDARSERFRLRAPKALAKYIAHKGSITVDGTSLTVNKVEGAEFELNIVPHTLEKTVMGTYQPGTRVNLEVDVIARYLERLLQGDDAAEA
jgi:riboflavin synthase